MGDAKHQWLREKLGRLAGKIMSMPTMERMIRSHRSHDRPCWRFAAAYREYRRRMNG